MSRRRTDIEDRIREAKPDAALRRLPSGVDGGERGVDVGRAAAGNLPVLLQALTGLDRQGRAHAARLSDELPCVPARLVRHGRRVTLRLPPGERALSDVLAKIRELDPAA